MEAERPVAILGASGSIGDPLLRALVRDRVPVVAASRKGVGVVDPLVRDLRVDLGNTPASEIREHLRDCRTVYYLVHSLAERDAAAASRIAADRVVEALAGLDIELVYVGSLGHGRISEHIASRQEVGRILRAGVPTVEIQAGIVLGRDFIGVQMLRAVVERWGGLVSSATTKRHCQPVALSDLLIYLRAATELPPGCYEAGGPDVVTYRELTTTCARLLDHKVRFIPIPEALNGVGTLFLARALDQPRPLVRALVDSLGTEMVVEDDTLARHCPSAATGLVDALRTAFALA